MNNRTAEFIALLASTKTTADRIAIALEFAEVFINMENVQEIIDVLHDISPEVSSIFLDRVAAAPSSDLAWEAFMVIGANIDGLNSQSMKAKWRNCVEIIREFYASQRA